MHCSGMPKGTFLAEVKLNSEKIKLVALTIIKLQYSISYSVSQLLSQKNISLNENF